MKSYKKISFKAILLFLAFLIISPTFGQQQPDKNKKQPTKDQILDMTYEQLLNMPFEDLINLANIVGVSAEELLQMILNKEVTTASKFKETIFDSPLSTSAISAEEIRMSGANTIEEALRLIPGMIVREKTNGNYDVQIRGFDNVPPEGFEYFSENTITLVMIDGIPVYNNVNGGTFWETLPVSINQVERIDVVRGPASALYGPNAASGVINIITKQSGNKKININFDDRIGNFNTYLGDLYVSSKLSDKFKITFGGKYDYRDRYDDKYYSFLEGNYIPLEDSLRQISGLKYNGVYNQSLNKNEARKVLGANINLLYDLNKDIKFRLSGGIQDSKIQTAFFENLATPFSVRLSNIGFLSFQGNVKNLAASVSYQGGHQNLSEGALSPVLEYKMSNINANLEYNFIFKNLSVRPGVNYQSASYNDSKYEQEQRLAQNNNSVSGLFHGAKTTGLIAGSLRADYKAFDKLRLIAAARIDNYDYIKKNSLSYQLIASYKLNENNLIRVSYAQANRGAFVGDMHANFANPIMDNSVAGVIPHANIAAYGAYIGPLAALLPKGDTIVTASYNQYYRGSNVSNYDLKLLTVNTVELGWRSKLGSKFQVDIEGFMSRAKDFDALVGTAVKADTTFYTIAELTHGAGPANKTPFPKHLQFEDTLFYHNLPLEATQYGVSATVNISVSKKLQFKLFGTWQQTKLKKQINLDMDTVDITHKNTPAFYGGITAIFAPTPKWNFYLGSYFYSNQVYTRYWRSSATLPAATAKEYATDHINGKIILDAKISYKFWKDNRVYIQGKNLLFDNHREFGFTDPINTLILLGVNFNF